MGNAGNSVKSVQNDREGRQPGISEQRIKLVVPRLSRGHESSKTPEFSSEWMVTNVQQPVQKLSGAGDSLQPTPVVRAVSPIAYKNQRRKAAAVSAIPASASMPCHTFRRVATDHREAVFK